MNYLCRGSIVEVVKSTPGARHPVEARGLEIGDRFSIKAYRNCTVVYESVVGDLRVTEDRLRLVPTVGSETARDDIEIDRYRTNEWFVYRKSDNNILCQGVRPSLAPFKFYCPIIWSDYRKAENWIKEGVIADIQEYLCNLDIRFTKIMTV